MAFLRSLRPQSALRNRREENGECCCGGNGRDRPIRGLAPNIQAHHIHPGFFLSPIHHSTRSILPMPRTTVALGILLIILGLAAYLGTGRSSATALIPAFFGLPLLVLGLLGHKDHLRKHAMHAAAGLALIGFLGTVSGLYEAFVLLGGGAVERPAAAVVQALMALMCAIFIALSIRSFVHARRSRS